MSMTFAELSVAHPDFVVSMKDSQIEANAGWKTPPTDFVDKRIFYCPTCKAPGMNTCWGFISYTCGASILSDGEPSEPCPKETAP